MKIKLNNIKLFGYHGLNQNETDCGQYFLISVSMAFNKDMNEIDDDISNTLDYTVVYNLVKNEFNKKRFKLLESLCYNIKREIKTSKIIALHNPIEIVVSISKSGKLFDGHIDSFEVSTN